MKCSITCYFDTNMNLSKAMNTEYMSKQVNSAKTKDVKSKRVVMHLTQ